MSPPLTRTSSWHFASLSVGKILRFFTFATVLWLWKAGCCSLNGISTWSVHCARPGRTGTVLQSWRVSALNRIIFHGSSVTPPPPPPQIVGSVGVGKEVRRCWNRNTFLNGDDVLGLFAHYWWYNLFWDACVLVSPSSPVTAFATRHAFPRLRVFRQKKRIRYFRIKFSGVGHGSVRPLVFRACHGCEGKLQQGVIS
jgi:hypothetical protein